MEPTADPVTVNDVLVQAAKLTHEQRRARIRQCVAEKKHTWDRLPVCVEPARNQIAHYCDRCWSVIDREGHTWSWAPSQFAAR